MWIAKVPGAYRVEVRSDRPTDVPARYELKFAGVRVSTGQDRAVNQAAGLIAEADIDLVRRQS
ncbi:MAG: hypothetical protein QOK48_754 [Blastocatellia bacterium]|nr:hypothetical protein [Blastocatellia bacterium]